MKSLRKSFRASVKRANARKDRRDDPRLEDEEQPLLQKTDSYARREKSGRSFVEPKLLTKKKSQYGPSSSRISLPPVSRRVSRPSVVILSDAEGDSEEEEIDEEDEEDLVPIPPPVGLSKSTASSGARSRPGAQARAKAKTKSRPKKVVVDLNNPFSGRWVSEGVGDEENFLQELEVSSKFSKIASKYAGSQRQTLDIEQHGSKFTIISNNDRREVIHTFTVGVEFYSENEKGDETTCSATWERGKTNGALVVRSKVTAESSPNKGSTRIIRREVLTTGKLREEVRDASSNRVVSNRYYARTG